jgi:phage-related baseplate assembly protein
MMLLACMPISSIATSPAIDLSRLPPPVIVPQTDFETRYTAKRAQLLALFPPFDALVESDPVIKLLQADAFDEQVLSQAFNDAARQLLIAFATGSSLDHLAALYAVERLVITPANPVTGVAAVLETDDDLRQRVLLAPHSFSVAGPEMAYVYHAKSASGDVLDASATSPQPGEVVVSVLSRTGDGTAPPATLAAVEAVLTDDQVRPLTDMVTVQSADVQPFDVVAGLWLYAGPDAELIRSTALASLNAYLAGSRRLGRDIPLSALVASLHVAGVQRVELVSPIADQVFTALQSGHCASIDVTIAGTWD